MSELEVKLKKEELAAGLQVKLEGLEHVDVAASWRKKKAEGNVFRLREELETEQKKVPFFPKR